MENRFQILDSLRGIAAIALVCYHLLRVYEDPGINFIIHLGRIGTDVFFVISGFLTAIAAKSVIADRKTPVMFLTARAYKIYLVYFFSLITAAIIIPTVIGLLSSLKSAVIEFNFTHFSLVDWIKIITLIKVFDSTDEMLYKTFLPLNGVYWFIAIIFQIYIFIFICLLFKKIFYCLVSIVGIASIILLALDGDTAVPHGLFLHKFHEFFFGMASYWIYSKFQIKNSLRARILLIFIIFAIPLADLMVEKEPYLRFLWSVMIAIAIPLSLVVEARTQANIVLKFFRNIGVFSFSIYLIHAPLIPLADMLARNFTSLAAKQYLPCIAFPLIIIMCYFWSIFFERPGSLLGTLNALRHPIRSVYKKFELEFHTIWNRVGLDYNHKHENCQS